MIKRELIPKPRSNFVRVKCPKCGNEQIIFDRASISPRCSVCEEILAEASGGKAKFKSEIVQVLS